MSRLDVSQALVESLWSQCQSYLQRACQSSNSILAFSQSLTSSCRYIFNSQKSRIIRQIYASYLTLIESLLEILSCSLKSVFQFLSQLTYTLRIQCWSLILANCQLCWQQFCYRRISFLDAYCSLASPSVKLDFILLASDFHNSAQSYSLYSSQLLESFSFFNSYKCLIKIEFSCCRRLFLCYNYPLASAQFNAIDQRIFFMSEFFPNIIYFCCWFSSISCQHFKRHLVSSLDKKDTSLRSVLFSLYREARREANLPLCVRSLSSDSSLVFMTSSGQSLVPQGLCTCLLNFQMSCSSRLSSLCLILPIIYWLLILLVSCLILYPWGPMPYCLFIPKQQIQTMEQSINVGM